jgi:hypothetical protein
MRPDVHVANDAAEISFIVLSFLYDAMPVSYKNGISTITY